MIAGMTGSTDESRRVSWATWPGMRFALTKFDYVTTVCDCSLGEEHGAKGKKPHPRYTWRGLESGIDVEGFEVE